MLSVRRAALFFVAFIASTIPELCAQAPTPKPEAKDGFAGKKAGEEWDGNGLKMKFCWCPAGKFTMGSPKEEKGRENNEDQVSVTISRGFWLGKYEVTQREWKANMDTQPWLGKELVKEGTTYPATHVSSEHALKFCEELTRKEHAAGRLPADWKYDLPTEAQWEYACRAGEKTRFSFGDDEDRLGDFAWYTKNAWDLGEKHAYAHEVGTKRPNPWGLHDMHGNVWEWCRDRYVKDLPGGSDPEVTEGAAYRVHRGGSWVDYARYCRSAYRIRRKPDYRDGNLGFRLTLVHSR